MDMLNVMYWMFYIKRYIMYYIILYCLFSGFMIIGILEVTIVVEVDDVLFYEYYLGCYKSASNEFAHWTKAWILILNPL